MERFLLDPRDLFSVYRSVGIQKFARCVAKERALSFLIIPSTSVSDSNDLLLQNPALTIPNLFKPHIIPLVR